jgi:hypothetical protein
MKRSLLKEQQKIKEGFLLTGEVVSFTGKDTGQPPWRKPSWHFSFSFLT